ncbi:MAG: hypothetical protein JW955_20815 [Sedimentisphaerales bacterium]|nr:hypothetical protein [Sedimentisphaerales bacterium]
METPADRAAAVPPSSEPLSPPIRIVPPSMASPAPGRPVPPMPPAPTADGGQDPAVRLLIPVGRCPLAIAAGYLGLLSLFPLMGGVAAPFGLGLAVIAHRQIRGDAKLHGMGRVIFAYIACSLSLIGHLIWLFAAL